MNINTYENGKLHLGEMDPDELVDLLGLSSERLIELLEAAGEEALIERAIVSAGIGGENDDDSSGGLYYASPYRKPANKRV